MTHRSCAGGWVVRLCAAVLLLALCLAGRPGVSLAHAALLGSEPSDGAALAAAPSSVVLRFDEEVGLIQLRLVGPGGTEVRPTIPPRVDGPTLRAGFPADLPPGVYLLSYRVTSADSHLVAGAVAFGIGAASGPAHPAASEPRSSADVWTLPSQAARWLFYVAVTVAAGGVGFRLLVAEVPRGLRQGMLAIAAGGAALATLQVGLRGALLAGLPADGLLRPAAWRLGSGTTLALSLLLSGAGLLGCAASLLGTGRGWRAAGGAAAVLTLAGFTFSGHAATAEPRWVTSPALAAHVAVAVFWLGAFWPLRALLREGAAASAPVRRFSRLAVPAVALLAAGGGALAAVQVASPAALPGTRYGQLVVAKLLLFAALLGLAAWNRNRLTPALAGGLPGAADWLRRTITAEAVIGVAILAVTAVLTLTPPPRASGHPGHGAAEGPAAAAGMGHDHHGHDHAHGVGEGATLLAQAGGILATIEVVPARAGPNTLRVTLDRAQGEVPAPREVWLELSQPEAGVGPVRRPLRRGEAGSWMHQGPELAIPGRWSVRIEVLLTDFDQAALSTEVDVR